MSDTIFLIGNKDDYKEYEANMSNIDTLPLANLPVSYFPFFYNSIETSVEKMKRLVPLIENHKNVNAVGVVGNTATYTIDTDKLFSLLTNLEESYQPFNNNNIFHLKIFVVVIWILIVLCVLKFCYFIMREHYTYFIMFLIFTILILSTIWALVITSKHL